MQLMTMSEMCREGKLSRSKLRSLLRERGVPQLKIGRCKRVQQKDWHGLLESCVVVDAPRSAERAS